MPPSGDEGGKFIFKMATNVRTIGTTLQWRHNGHDGVSNHQPNDCLPNRLFRHRSKKTSKLRVTGLCEGNSPVIGEFAAQMASNAENVSIWWRYHGIIESFKYNRARFNAKRFITNNVTSAIKDHTSDFDLAVCREWLCHEWMQYIKRWLHISLTDAS